MKRITAIIIAIVSLVGTCYVGSDAASKAVTNQANQYKDISVSIEHKSTSEGGVK